MANTLKQQHDELLRENSHLVAAAQGVLDYAGMEEFLASAGDNDVFGIRARDLRTLRSEVSNQR